MGRSQETFSKKEVRNKKEKKRKEKEQKRALKKSEGKKSSFDDMIAYVDEFGKISSTPPDPDKKTVVVAESIELKITKNNPENALLISYGRELLLSLMNQKVMALSVTWNPARVYSFMQITFWSL